MFEAALLAAARALGPGGFVYLEAPQPWSDDRVADLGLQALDDAGLTLKDVDGLITIGPQFHEAGMFVPAMAAEYLGVSIDFAEVVDLGGASSVGMVWRAAAAIELGLCNTVLCVIPSRMAPAAPNDDHIAEVMRASRQVSDLEARLSELRNKYLQEARQEVARLEDELSSQRHKHQERHHDP